MGQQQQQQQQQCGGCVCLPAVLQQYVPHQALYKVGRCGRSSRAFVWDQLVVSP
jgi:hypothetical protein